MSFNRFYVENLLRIVSRANTLHDEDIERLAAGFGWNSLPNSQGSYGISEKSFQLVGQKSPSDLNEQNNPKYDPLSKRKGSASDETFIREEKERIAIKDNRSLNQTTQRKQLSMDRVTLIPKICDKKNGRWV